jgi:RNA methyltransferase, TrmH family
VVAAKVTRISSRSNPLLARLRRLADDGAAYRREGLVLLEGEHLCAAWRVRSDALVPHAILSEAAWEEPRLRALASAAAEVAVVSGAAMASLGSLDSPAAIAFLVAPPGAAEVLPDAPTVVLDRIQDPGNAGGLLRSAAAFGFRQAIALVGTAALWSPKALRAGMGAHFGLHLVEGADGAALARLTVPVFATSPHAEERVDAFALPWPCAWAFGHEGQGVAAGVAARCRAVLRVPQPGGQESLNVAAAAAICLYESARRRGR